VPCCGHYSPAFDPSVAELGPMRRVGKPQLDLSAVGVCPLPGDVRAVHGCGELVIRILLEQGDITSRPLLPAGRETLTVGRQLTQLDRCSGYPLKCSGLLLAGADERGERVGVGVHGLLEQAVEEQASAT